MGSQELLGLIGGQAGEGGGGTVGNCEDGDAAAVVVDVVGELGILEGSSEGAEVGLLLEELQDVDGRG